MNTKEKNREKVSVSLDSKVLDKVREVMREVQICRLAEGKKPTSLSRMLEAAVSIGLQDTLELEQIAVGARV
mgnify:CR=1 FL=1